MLAHGESGFFRSPASSILVPASAQVGGNEYDEAAAESPNAI